MSRGDRHYFLSALINMICRTLIAICLLITLDIQPTKPADQTDIAVSTLEFGGSVSKLLWVSIRDQQRVDAAGADGYVKLAEKIRMQIDLGRASSAVVGANFNLIATTLGYSAVVDPEPLTKAVAGVAAYGAKKAGDALGQAVLDASQEQARGILAQGLKESGISSTELQSINPDQLRSRVADLQVGGVKLRELLRDTPGAISMIEAASVDLATKMGVEALARTGAVGTDVTSIKADVAKTMSNLADYQKVVKQRLDRIDVNLSQLQQNADIANAKLDKLRDQVQGNTAAIQSLAAISYSG